MRCGIGVSLGSAWHRLRHRQRRGLRNTMAGTPMNASHPIQSLLGQSDSPDNPAKQLVATNNKDASVTTSLKVLTSLVNQVWEMTNKTWADADENFAIAFRTNENHAKRIQDLENERKLANLPKPADSHA